MNQQQPRRATADRKRETDRKSAPSFQRPRTWAQILGGVVAANALLAVFAPQAGQFLRVIQDFLWDYSGVFALLALTGAVVFGLASTDRLVLTVRQRVALQATHRAIAVGGVGFLISHIVLQVVYARVSVMNVLVPFGAPDIAVAFGSISSTLFILVVVTGILRSRFASGSRPWLWRVLHVSAYLSWAAAIVHGLNAGRHPYDWVTASYAICMVLVGLALVGRLVLTAKAKPKKLDREEAQVVEVQVAETLLREEAPIRETPTREAPVREGAVQGDLLAAGRTPESSDDDEEFWASLRGRGVR